MRLRVFSAVFLLLCGVLSAQVNQVKVEGYFSSEYVQSQKEGDFPHGSFQNPKLGLFFSADVSGYFRFLSEIRVVNFNEMQLEQAWLGMTPSDYFHLKLGVYRVPFGYYNEWNRPHQTMLVFAPYNIQNFFPENWKDLGLLIQGKARGLFYSAYFGNGLSESENLSTGQQLNDNNANKGMGLKIGYSSGGNTEIAYSHYRGKFDIENSRSLYLHGLHGFWREENFQILFEYTRARIENPPGFSRGEANGYFVQLSLNWGGLRPVASYQRFKYQDDFHGVGFQGLDQPGAGIFLKKRRWTIGAVYSISQNVFLKVEYDLNLETNEASKDNLFSCQLALSF